MKTNLMRYSRFIQRDLIGLIRADEWWEYKLVPILSTFYATALVLHVAVSSLWVSALSLLLAIVPAAIYASVINDVTDLAGDLEAGKRNGVARPPPLVGAAPLALSLGAGFLFPRVLRAGIRVPLRSSARTSFSLSSSALSRPCYGRSAAHGRRLFSCCTRFTPFAVRAAGKRRR